MCLRYKFYGYGNMNSLLRGDIPVMHHTIHHAWEVLRYPVMLH